MNALDRCTWSSERLGEALEVCARAAHLGVRGEASLRSKAPAATAGILTDSAWIEAAAEAMQIEAEPVECPCGELEAALPRMVPAIARLTLPYEHRYLAIVRSTTRSLTLITPDLEKVTFPIATIATALNAAMADDTAPVVDKWLRLAEIAPRRLAKGRAKLLKLALLERTVSNLWLLRDDPGVSFARNLHRKGLSGLTARYIAISLMQVVLSVGSWLVLGKGALDGRIELGWLQAWLILALASIPLQVASSYIGGCISLEIAELLKQRLLCGALRMDPNDVRIRGSGGLLATVTESEAVEAAAMTGAFGALSAVIQLASAGFVLSIGAGGTLLVCLLVLWCLGLTGLVVVVSRRRDLWTQQRFALSNSIVENIIGHRTRLAQQRASDFHGREDRMLERYLRASESLNRLQTSLAGVPSRGWLALALFGLLPVMLLGHAERASLLITVGGIMQAQAGISSFLSSVGALLALSVSWRSIGALFNAAARREMPGAPDATIPATVSSPVADAEIVLEARGISFQYSGTAKPVLQSCDLTMKRGERVLLEGRSGGGKSTLAAVLCGLQTPQSGFLAVGGLDRKTLGGTAWRKRIASAPQFHENHILTGSLSFNLLMGRAWPPSESDLAEAEAVCRELGLGDLLDKMPSKLLQLVGETGWQLSHGERSRVFLARALLQKGDVLVLDESFGALDPLTLQTCLDCVRARAETLLVIAHP